MRAVATYITSDKETKQTILKRGEALNNLFQSFNKGEVNGVDLIKELLSFYPSFANDLEKNKVSKNVVQFIYDNDKESYNLMELEDSYDVDLQELRSEVKKQSGLNGLIEFDKLMNDGYNIETATKQLNIKVA